MKHYLRLFCTLAAVSLLAAASFSTAVFSSAARQSFNPAAPLNASPIPADEVRAAATPAPTPSATVITVNSLSDAAADDGLCTLREAITSANSHTVSGAATGECAAGTGTGNDFISFIVVGTINLSSALPDITSNVTMTGAGANFMTVQRSAADGTPDFRVFTVASGATVQISGLTIANGRTPDGVATGSGIGSLGGAGGGVSNAGTLTLTACVISGNVTGQGGPGSGGGGGFGGSGGFGGGVSNSGTLTMSGCTVSGNRTGDAGTGGFAGAGGTGGGIYNSGTLTLTDCLISNNATGNGAPKTSSAGIAGFGGAGGGITNYIGGVLNITGSVINNNATGDAGDGGNSGGSGGGILNQGTATLTSSTVRDNRTGAAGQAPTAGAGMNGGGVYNGGTLSVNASTVSGNTCGDSGGGLLNYGSSTLKMSNSTVSGNHAGLAGAVFNDSNATLGLTNCTVADNTAPNSNGVVSMSSASLATVGNSIIARNGTGSADAIGRFNSLGHNLVGSEADGGTGPFPSPFFSKPGDQEGTTSSPLDPHLGPLADNGGPTRTHALLRGSTALDAGDNSLAVDTNNNPLTTDQRGASFPRFASSVAGGQVVDIGAFEVYPYIEDITDKETYENTSLAPPFSFGDAAIGVASITGTSSNTALVPNDSSHISFNGAGGARAIQITPVANTSGSTTITVTVTGINGQTASDTFLLTVKHINRAPTLDALADLTINEDAGTQTVNLSGISAGPGESQNLTVTATSSDTLLIPNPSVSYSTPASTGSLSFKPAPDRNGGPVTVTVRVQDEGGTGGGGIDAVSRTFQVTVNAVNDAPVNTVPGAQTTVENSPLVFSAANSNALSVADVDAGTDPFRVTLSAAHGTLTLGSAAGLTFTAGDGADDASMTFDGSSAAVNAALNGLTFKPEQGFSGAASLQIVTDDQGHNGAGGAKSDADSVAINVVSGGTLQLSAATAEAGEGAGTTTFKVTRTGGSAGAASVGFATSAGTATGGASCAPGVDFVNASGTLSWADGETADKTFAVTLCDDSAHEPDETLLLSLSGATGSAGLGTPSSSTLTIKDDDPAGGFIEFAQSNYTTAEGAGSLTVKVKRTGDTSRAADVDYATDDGSVPSVAVPCSAVTGLALERCDFTKALGTLHFDAGQTEQTFKLLIGDDSYSEGTETATLKLSNPAGGAALGAQSSSTLTITDDSPESSGNPVDDSSFFVTQHYYDFLNREPDADGLRFWTGGITGCGADSHCVAVKRVDTSAAFFLSIEFQETGYLVERVYKTAFGDAIGSSTFPVPHTLAVPAVRLDEFLFDTQRIGQGVVVGQDGWQTRLEDNKNAFALDFVSRRQFAAAFPSTLTADEFVARLDQNAGGVLTADQKAQLAAQMGATPADPSKRASVLRQVAENPVLDANEKNRAFVLMQFFGYLRRNPNDAPDADYTGYDFWLQKLDQFNGNFVQAEMVKAFITSIEYRQRFGR